MGPLISTEIASAVVASTLLVWLGATYSSLKLGLSRLRRTWAKLEGLLAERHEIVGRIESCKDEFLGEHRKLIDDIAFHRSRAVGVEAVRDRAEAENAISVLLRMIVSIIADDDRLRTNETLTDIGKELPVIEHQIQDVCSNYNAQAKSFNKRALRLPSRLIAGLFGFGAVDEVTIELVSNK